MDENRSDEHNPDEFYYPDEVEENSTIPSNSQEQIDAFIVDQRSVNTRNKTISDMNTLQRYLKSIGMEDVRMESLPAEKLDHILSKFFMNAKKVDGKSDYEPGTMTGFQRSFQRYLDDNNTTYNIFKDEAFKKSGETFAAKRRFLVKSGKGNKPNAAKALGDEEENALFASGEFGDSTPQALQRTVWWLLSMHFGFRARDESRKLQWGDIELQKDPTTGVEMLVFLTERGTKTRTGQERGHQRAFQPKAFATKTDRCPVKYYKLFKSHRPAAMNSENSPFFLAVRHHRGPNDPVWYMKSPLGKNEIGKFLSTAAARSGLQLKGKKLTNHSVRKTCISRLLDANVPETFVAQLSGHKNINSLQCYKTASTSQQQQMSSTLSREMASFDYQSDRGAKRIMQVQQSFASSSSTVTIAPTTSDSSASQSCSHSTNSATTSKEIFPNANIRDCFFNIYHGPVTMVMQDTDNTDRSAKRLRPDLDCERINRT